MGNLECSKEGKRNAARNSIKVNLSFIACVHSRTKIPAALKATTMDLTSMPLKRSKVFSLRGSVIRPKHTKYRRTKLVPIK